MNGVLLTKTDAKGQQFTYTYDGYKRPYQISVGGNVIRTFYYDSNSFDSTFSQNALGRLTAVLHAPFVAVPGTPQISHQFVEMYSYTQAGLPNKKRLQTNENIYYDQTHNHTGTINLDATYAYDNEGKMTSVNYPTTYGVDQDENLIPAAGPTYTYSFDEMHRPKILTDQNNAQLVNGVTYGAANQLLTMSYFGVNETRTYNSMLQMTRLNIPGQVDISYTFPSATTNNGKINSQTDNISGETVTYQYDSLNRLSSANGSGWNQNFGYDGFGNLVSKTGTNSPALSVAIDATTNRVVGQSYDANGNQQTSPTVSGYLGYDPENRLLTAPGVQYAYDAQNKRIWKGMFDGNGYLTNQELYFYGIDGQKLGTYTLMADYGQNRQTVLWDPYPTLAVFFGGKRVAVGGVVFVPDRLGSKGKYYPYGEERNSPPLANDQVKFAGYVRDSATGLDYAEDDKSYYIATFGRFMTPLKLKTRGKPEDPGTWNLYPYEGKDPINNVSNPEEDPCDFVLHCYDPGDPTPPPDCPIGFHDDGFGRCVPDGPGPGDGDPGRTLLPHSRIQGFQSALDALNSQECAEALGAVNGEAAKLALNGVSIFIEDFGRPIGTITPLPGGLNEYSVTYKGGQTNGMEITMNTPIFLNPSAPIAAFVDHPEIPIHNMLDVLANEFNLKELTTGQFQAILLLHELGHVMNGFGDDTGNFAKSEANTRTVIENCFPFSKK